MIFPSLPTLMDYSGVVLGRAYVAKRVKVPCFLVPISKETLRRSRYCFGIPTVNRKRRAKLLQKDPTGRREFDAGII